MNTRNNAGPGQGPEDADPQAQGPQDGAPHNGPDLEDLARELETLRADMERLVGTLADFGRAQGAGIADDMRARAERLRARSAEAESRLGDLAAEADSLARERPAAAMGIAAALGFFLGIMMMRR